MSGSSSERMVVVLNRAGLHMRPADLLARAASRFKCQIEIARQDGQGVDCKSILSILTLAAPQGCQLMLKANGSDAHDAVEFLASMFAEGFNELEEEASSQGEAVREQSQ